jgi:Prefoldin, molecular chaperone implicated in de novo protein folding, alpha subunit
LTPDEQRYVLDILNYQFGEDVASAFSKFIPHVEVRRSPSTWRMRSFRLNGRLLMVLRAQDNMFSLTPLAGEIISRSLPSPRLRLIVMDDVSQFILEGGDVFCKHVIDLDPTLRAGDEAIAVSKDGKPLAVGRMNLSGEEVRSYKRGVALFVRRGFKE